ncbi:MAG: hypothetical protein IT306_22725 [Chloroflexi bacterium]|nr:hypothetical protein [Chloroflexota bacterium]
MIFFDRSIPRSVAQALRLVRDDIRWLDDEFASDAPDRVWLREVGRRERLVVSRDKRSRHRPAERQAIIDNGVGCFVLVQSANPTQWEYLRLIVALLDHMEDLFATTARPFVYGIDRAGGLRRLV